MKSKVLLQAYHVISYLIRNSLVNYKSNNLVESKANKNIPNLISNFIKFLKVSQQNSDFILAKELLYGKMSIHLIFIIIKVCYIISNRKK